MLRRLVPAVASSGNRTFVALACVPLAAALAGPVASVVQAEGAAAALLGGLGVSAATWLALGIALRALWRGRSLRFPPLSIAYLVAFATLLPSATAAWLVLAALAAWAMRRQEHDEPTRTGLVVLCALALREPVAGALLGALAAPLMELDAALVTQLLDAFGAAATRNGNIVANGNGVELIVLTGCASFSNVSLALIAWFAVVRGAGRPLVRRQKMIGALLAVAVVAINVLRLAAMSIGPETYAWLHDGMGADIFLGVLCLIVAAACRLALRP